MTMQETRAETSSTASAPDPSSVVPSPSSRPVAPNVLADWLTTGDHRRIGRLYVAFSLLFAVAVLVVGALLAFERVDDGGLAILHADAVSQLVSFYGIGLVFCVAVPLMLGLATAIVPLQIGARSIAFPRAVALSFWAWLAGSGIMVGAYLANGGPGGGNDIAVDLFLAAFGLTVIALLLDALCLAATVLTLRAPGMTLDRLPYFSWSVVVSATVLLMSLPVLVGELIYLYVDHRYGQAVFGGNVGIEGNIGWALAAPQLFAYAIVVLGLVADTAATFARQRLQKPESVMVAIALAGVVGFGAWVQPALYPGATESLLAKVMAIGAVLPPLLVLGAVALTLKAGRPSPGSPLIWTLAALLVLLAGSAVGVLLPFPGLELAGTVYGVAQFNFVALAVVLAGLGGLVYWGPKLWGRRPADGVLRLLAVGGFLAVALVAVPDVIAGFLKQPAGTVSDFGVDGPLGLLNALSGVGYVLLALVVLGVIAVTVRGFVRGTATGDDPWDGQTLEWATSSPPPDGNFTELPVVASAEPLVDVKLAARASA
jgi:heme/copper-type cytochrome/quinol oxidase subunit 1